MKIGLATQMFLALILGCICGLIVSAVGINPAHFKPLGDVFITLIRMVVVPLVFFTLIAGSSSISDLHKLGSIAVKTLVYYVGTTAIAVTIGVIIANVIQPGVGLTISTEGVKALNVNPPSLVKVFMDIIPLNPFEALSKGNMLQVIFFALFVGMACSTLRKELEVVNRVFEGLAEIMLKITSVVMLYAPIGVFALMTFTVGTYGLDVLLPLLKLIVAMFIACVLHVLLCYIPCIRFTGLKIKHFFSVVTSPLLIAFSSTSSAAALSSNLQSVQKLGASKPVSTFMIPLGNTINMDGAAIYMGVASVFAAALYGIDLTIDKQLLIIVMAVLASIGSIGVPGAALIMITMVFTQIGIPLEAIAIIAGVDRILDMMRTSLNVLGDATGAVLVSKLEGDFVLPEEDIK